MYIYILFTKAIYIYIYTFILLINIVPKKNEKKIFILTH